MGPGTVNANMVNERVIKLEELEQFKKQQNKETITDQNNTTENKQETKTVKTNEKDVFSAVDTLNSLKHFATKGELYTSGVFSYKKASPEAALENLKAKKPIYVSNTLGEKVEIKSAMDLQVIDSIYGIGEKRVITQEAAEGLLKFEKGMDKNDGIFTSGKGFWKAVKRLNAFDTYKELEKLKSENKNDEFLNIPFGNDDDNKVKSIDDIAELYVLQAGGKNNTLLKQNVYDAFMNFKEFLIQGEKGLTSRKAFDALQELQAGNSIYIDAKGRNTISTFDNLVELNAIYGNGKNTFMPHDQFALLKMFDESPVIKLAENAYNVIQQLKNGTPVSFSFTDENLKKYNNSFNKINSFSNLKELQALYIDGKNNLILQEDQFNALKYLADSLPSAGFSKNGEKLNAYNVLQLLKNGTPVNFYFNGGDFNEKLSITTDSLSKLPQAKQMYDNQKEYDKYKYGFSEEFKNKLTPFVNKLFPLVVSQFRSIPGHINNAKDHISSSLSALQGNTNTLETSERNADNFANAINNDIGTVNKSINDINKVDFPVTSLEMFLGISKGIAAQVWPKMHNINDGLNQISNMINEKRARDNNNGGSYYESDNTNSNGNGSYYESGTTNANRSGSFYESNQTRTGNGGSYYESGESESEKRKSTSGGSYYESEPSSNTSRINSEVADNCRRKIQEALDESDEFQGNFKKLLINIETMYNAVYEANTKMSNAKQKLNEANTELSNSKNSLSDVRVGTASSIITSKVTNDRVREKVNNANALLSKAHDTYGSIELKEGTEINKTASNNVVGSIEDGKNSILSSNQEKEALNGNINGINSSIRSLDNDMQRAINKIGSALDDANSSSKKITWWGKEVSEWARGNANNSIGNLENIEEYLGYIRRNIDDEGILYEVRKVENEVSMAKNLMGQESTYISANTAGFNVYEKLTSNTVSSIENAKSLTGRSKGVFTDEVTSLISSVKRNLDTSKEEATKAASSMTTAQNLTSVTASLAESANLAKSTFNSVSKENPSLIELKTALGEIEKLASGDLDDMASKGLKLINNQETRPERPANWVDPSPRVMQ